MTSVKKTADAVDISQWRESVIIEVPFHDVDVMEVAWHGHYVKYFEIARCALLDKMDYNYRQMRSSGFAWPVIDMHVRYAQPALFQQKIRVEAILVEYEYRLKIKFIVTDAETGQRLTKGHTVQVAVDMAEKEMCFQSPKVLYDKLGIGYV